MSSKSSSKKGKRRSRSYKNIIILAIVVVILAAIYYYVKIYTDESKPVVNQGLPQSEYVLLENTDSINNIAMVMYSTNVNINVIANTFYKNNIFWPYVFVANQKQPEVKQNPLDIPQGVIIKIPRIPYNLLDINNPEAIRKVEALADSILNSKEEIKPTPTIYSR